MAETSIAFAATPALLGLAVGRMHEHQAALALRKTAECLHGIAEDNGMTFSQTAKVICKL